MDHCCDQFTDGTNAISYKVFMGNTSQHERHHYRSGDDHSPALSMPNHSYPNHTIVDQTKYLPPKSKFHPDRGECNHRDECNARDDFNPWSPSGKRSPSSSSSSPPSHKHEVTIPTVFKWTRSGAKSVSLCGSFNNWLDKIVLTKSEEEFTTIVNLPLGNHQYKYLVDGAWTFDPDEPKIENEFHSYNNYVEVKQSDFEVFEALAADDDTPKNNAEFSQVIPVRNPGSLHARPPVLPPQLLQIVLNKDSPYTGEPTLLPEPQHVEINHLYALSIKDGVMTLSSTHRYKQKYVTTLFYRPS